ncbi:MAG: pyridoxal-phosphate dependent enzyme, partial [Sphingomonadaceae bacterium]
MSEELPVAIDDIRAAAERIEGAVVRTPTSHSRTFSDMVGAETYLKFENLQFTAAYKERGALNKLLLMPEADRERGVIAASAGNHAQAVAFHAARLGVSATIVMPRATPFVKIAATERHGAKIVLEGETLYEAGAACADLAKREGRTVIHPYDDPLVIAGQGTVGMEMLADVPELDTLVVPVGGGGLIAGIATAAKAAKPDIAVVGAEAALYPSAHDALAGAAERCGGSTLAEGIAVKAVGALTLPIIAARVERIVLVDEPALERAVNAYLTLQKTMAEGAGAAGLAAMLTAPHHFRGRTVGLVLCGGNIDPRLLASIMVR